MSRLGIVTILAVVAGAAAGQGPSPQELKKADALIAELYGEEIARTKDAKGLARLAGQLLQDAKETTDYPAGRWMLLERAQMLAKEAGDGPLAMDALEESFLQRGVKGNAPDAIRRKIELLIAIRSANGADARRFVVDSALTLLEDTMAADDYASAGRVLDLAEAAARELKSVALLTDLRRRQEDVRRAQTVFERYRPFADRLVKLSADPEAAAQMGLYYGLVKGEWDRALPLLARGNDAGWKALALADLANPREAVKKLELGQQWSKARESAKPLLRLNVDLRACRWLQAAVNETQDRALRSKAQAQLDWIIDNLPAEYRSGEIAAEWKRCEGHRGPAYAAAFSPDGKKVASVGADGDVHLWDAKSGKELRRLEGAGTRLWCVAFADDGRRLVTGGFDGAVRLWDVLSGREIRMLGKHGGYVRRIGFSADGRVVYSAGDDRAVRLWNVDAGKEVKTLMGHDHFVWDAALSADGLHLLSGSLDKTARIWDVATGKQVKKLDGHQGTVLAVALSADGRRALTGSTDRSVKYWDLESGQCVATLEGHRGYVHSVSLSPDGRRALSAGQDRTIRLWDLPSLAPLRVLDSQPDQIWSVAFSRDGRFAVSAGQDGTVRIWGAPRSSVDTK